MNKINRQTLEDKIQYGIGLALAQGNLESYLETYLERDNSPKISWISSLINTFAHVHSGKLKLADFRQSILLPLDIDITSANENNLDVQIKILYLDSFPNVDDVICGEIIRKCWRGDYASMENVKDEVRH
ncbi:hypothetical protein P175DRAFT_0506505 [Aspergillus ochraceoroseus IBT 24754]|uniref:Uncharacterized protein n=1 Tax=Aspergillus ochraceoroseus IBT 24754 TaxID=1392256 RepID=A0A2T5M8U9_9EURO|nr:uncharacterized protein P175DRAFT_0506505 [Aspergillus ochraceoroseus IBT 24754]PTU24963.1 hypothetical protein P175DRAFT_0506505 [Aspergillus ochraceoroseus IBT 24754]